MKITVSHNRAKDDVKHAIDRSFDDVLRSTSPVPVQFVQEQRAWQGDRLSFSLSAKMGFMTAPIKGTIDVTDRDLTIDLDLGMLGNLIPADKLRDSLSTSIKGILK